MVYTAGFRGFDNCFMEVKIPQNDLRTSKRTWSLVKENINIFNYWGLLTYATDDVILLPPAAPINNSTFPDLSRMIVGHIDDNGQFPALIKFVGAGGSPYSLL